jgi:hypothetical protein
MKICWGEQKFEALECLIRLLAFFCYASNRLLNYEKYLIVTEIFYKSVFKSDTGLLSY